MKFNGLRILSVLVVSSLNFVSGHSYHLDECPDFDPMPEFVMEKSLGPWYAVQTTWPPSRCLVYDFTDSQKLGNTNCINCSNCTNCTNCTSCRGCSNCINCIECTQCTDCTNCISLKNCSYCTNCITCPRLNKREQTINNSNINIAISNNYSFIEELMADPSLRSRTPQSPPLNVAGKLSFVVFATDYVSYAGVYSCQKMPFSYKHYVTILSRSKVLEEIYQEKMINLLVSANVNPYDLSIVDQSDCHHSKENFSLDSNDEPFSPKNNISQVVFKASENIRQAIENVIDNNKEVFNLVKPKLAKDIKPGNIF